MEGEDAVSDSVSSSDVIDALREKVGDLVYENSILRAQSLTHRRKIEELEKALNEERARKADVS
jgi:regulator of replication initiation timing